MLLCFVEAVQNADMVYFFNFETGESIWDHPYDEFYKNLVREERKIIADVGLANYKPPPSDDPRLVPYKLKSPLNTLKPSSGVSTTTLSGGGGDVQQHQEMRRSLLRNEIDSGRELSNVEYEEEKHQQQQQHQQEEQDGVEYEDDYESDESAKSKGSDDDDEDDDDSSDGFKKPVDFGIEKELSIKLDRLNLPVTIGRDSKENQSAVRTNNNNDPDSMASITSARDQQQQQQQLDSPKRPYHRQMMTGSSKDDDESSNRKSLELLRSSHDQLETIDEEGKASSRLDELQKNLAQFSQKLQRKYDEECLELMENKDMKIKKIKQEIEESLNELREQENKRLTSEHNQKLKYIKSSLISLRLFFFSAQIYYIFILLFLPNYYSVHFVLK